MITFGNAWYQRNTSLIFFVIHTVLANLTAFDRRNDIGSTVSSSAQYRSFNINTSNDKYPKGTNIVEKNNEENVGNITNTYNSSQQSRISYGPLFQHHQSTHHFSKHKDFGQNSSSLKDDEQFHIWPADISNSISSLNEILTPSYIAVPPPPNSFLSGTAVKKIIPNMIALLSTFPPYINQQPSSSGVTAENWETPHDIFSTPSAAVGKHEREQYAPCGPSSSTYVELDKSLLKKTTALNTIKPYNHIHTQTLTIQDLTPEQLRYFHKEIRRQQEKTTKTTATVGPITTQKQPQQKEVSIEQTPCSFLSSLNPTLQPLETLQIFQSSSVQPYPSPVSITTQSSTQSITLNRTATNYLKAIPPPIFEPHARKIMETA